MYIVYNFTSIIIKISTNIYIIVQLLHKAILTRGE